MKQIENKIITLRSTKNYKLDNPLIDYYNEFIMDQDNNFFVYSWFITEKIKNETT